MPQFKTGDDANVIAKNGLEVKVNIEGDLNVGFVAVRVYDESGNLTGQAEKVNRNALLPLRGPFFGVRGQVLTTSPSHNDEEGEIIATAMSKSTKTFYKVQFKDGSVEWFNEDQVFIDVTKLKIV
jgi:uncharacterized protein YkvS